MGIKRMYTLITEGYFSKVDLVQEANKLGGIEILVDFNAFYLTLTNYYCHKMSTMYDNDYLKILWAEYDKFSNTIIRFHKEFENVGIKLVWIADGPKGIDKEGSEKKKKRWIDRDEADIRSIRNFLNNFDKGVPAGEIDNVFLPLRTNVILDSLKEVGAEVIQLLSGESDSFIANEFLKRDAYAILTNDTDFVVFPKCRVIFDRMLVYYYHNEISELPFIDKENIGNIITSFSEFYVPVVSQKDALEIFHFSDPDQMILLSMLEGTDNKENYKMELHHHLKLVKIPKRAYVKRVAEYIKNNSLTLENIWENPLIKSFIEKHPDFKSHLEFSRDSYTLNRIRSLSDTPNSIIYNSNDVNIDRDSLELFIIEKIGNNEMVKQIFAINKGIYYHLIAIEDPDKYGVHLTNVLAPLREAIYGYLLDNRYTNVKEYLPRFIKSEVDVEVHHSTIKADKIHGIHKDYSTSCDTPEMCGMNLFNRAVSHGESDPRNYFDEFDIDKAFILYLLRYLFVITHECNLKLTSNQFKAIFCGVFYQHSISGGNEDLKKILTKEHIYQFKICPTSKCVITFSWLTTIYWYFKYLLGDTFGLRSSFPNPSRLLSISVIVAFFERCCSNEHPRTSSLGIEIIDKLDLLMEEILKMYKTEFDIITRAS